MKKKLIRICAIVLVALSVCTVFSLSIVTNSQGSDPLVTLSYLTDIILPQIKNEILNDLILSGGVITTDVSTYEIVELAQGDSLFASSAVEIIARPGSDVRAISPFADQGIADISTNKEYLDGDVLDINSYCLIPRGEDGRGIMAYNEKSYILVRGEFYIVQNTENSEEVQEG